MDRTILDERVRKIALDELKKEWEKMYTTLHSFELLNQLTINGVDFINTGSNDGVISYHGLTTVLFDESKAKKNTNLSEILNKRLKVIEDKVLSEILEKLGKLDLEDISK